MPRRIRRKFAWIPPDRTTIWTLTIAGIDVTNFILDGKIPFGLLTEELVCEIELDNSGEDFTDKFNEDDEIVFKMDFDDGSTVQFKGDVEEIQNKLQDGLFKLGIKGSHFTSRFLDVTVTQDFKATKLSDMRNTLISIYAPDFTSNNVEENTTTIDKKFVNK